MAKDYMKLGNIFTAITFVLALFIAYGFVVGASSLFWVLAIFNLLCGPVCFVLYLIEVKKGVFSQDE